MGILITLFNMARKKKEEPVIDQAAQEEIEMVKRLWDLKNGIRSEKIERLEDILD